MANSNVPGVIARPVRGAVQGGTALIIVNFVDAFFADFTPEQFGSLVAVLTVVLSLLQVLAENGLGKAFLRRLPERDVPVTDTTQNGAAS